MNSHMTLVKTKVKHITILIIYEKDPNFYKI